jgi:hypothetical protein
MDGGFGGAILFSALSAVCVLYALYGAPVYTGNALAWSALIILGEYYVASNPARDWVRRFLRAWWASKVLEVCALGVLVYSVYSGTGLGLLASALWWQAVRWWQRDQLAAVGRRWVQGFVACEIDSR